MTYKNYSIETCLRTIAQLLEKHPHMAFYQKWTCDGCGKRLTANTCNRMFSEGHCEECGHVTDLQKTGCNYAVHLIGGGLASVPPQSVT